MEQGNTIQLFVVLFLSADNRCADGCTAADKQQGNPQCKVAYIAGLGKFGIVFQLRRYGVGFFDFLCTVLVAEILATAFAVPILNIALGILGRRLCVDMLEVRVDVCIKLTVGFTADFAYRFFGAGRFPAGVLSQLLAAIITLVVFVIVCTLADYIIADITFMVFVCIDAILRLRACRASVNGAGAGMGAVAVRCPFTEGVSVIDRNGHFSGVACLIGDNDFLFVVRRRENKAVVFIECDLRFIDNNGIDILLVNGNGLCLAIGLAVLYALDYGACSVQHDTVRANVVRIARLIGQSNIDNIFVIGVNAERCGVRCEGHAVKLRFCQFLI